MARLTPEEMKKKLEQLAAKKAKLAERHKVAPFIEEIEVEGAKKSRHTKILLSKALRKTKKKIGHVRKLLKAQGN